MTAAVRIPTLPETASFLPAYEQRVNRGASDRMTDSSASVQRTGAPDDDSRVSADSVRVFTRQEVALDGGYLVIIGDHVYDVKDFLDEVSTSVRAWS